MGYASALHYAAAVALISPLAPSIAAQAPHELTGADILRACDNPDRLEFCAGFIAAADRENGDRFLQRACPPAIIRYQPGNPYPVAAVLTYMRAHPKSASRPARDVVFDAITDDLSRMSGIDCSKK